MLFQINKPTLSVRHFPVFGLTLLSEENEVMPGKLSYEWKTEGLTE